ncbi:hypothetical protein RFI_05982 [Reticulomyxa filosa]|uniref:Uncharacterized protein n=1 Tax=Reticulomyxa filosa TaxID=46433 RepID=X6NYS8_RETFI|nr:hypothetical protein RFI_05982 [Reticulomyxa filosa]|eukprot:ETO31141.1 hypothetical protein RFI_05982 [Reticulomyxa filosa]
MNRIHDMLAKIDVISDVKVLFLDCLSAFRMGSQLPQELKKRSSNSLQAVEINFSILDGTSIPLLCQLLTKHSGSIKTLYLSYNQREEKTALFTGKKKKEGELKGCIGSNVSDKNLLDLYSTINKMQRSICEFELIMDGMNVFQQHYCSVVYNDMLPNFESLQVLQLHLTEDMLNGVTNAMTKCHKHICRCVSGLRSLHTIRLCVCLHSRMTEEQVMFVDDLYKSIATNPNICHVFMHETVTYRSLSITPFTLFYSILVACTKGGIDFSQKKKKRITNDHN